jgi:hypothetical protein
MGWLEIRADYCLAHVLMAGNGFCHSGRTFPGVCVHQVQWPHPLFNAQFLCQMLEGFLLLLFLLLLLLLNIRPSGLKSAAVIVCQLGLGQR